MMAARQPEPRRATAHFDVVDWWTVDPLDSPALDGRPLRVRESKIFRGDLIGEGEGDVVIRLEADGTRQTYRSVERITARLAGKQGTFLLEHWSAWSDAGLAESGGRIVAGSGTADLAGISGRAEISGDATGPHTIVLVYQLDRERAISVTAEGRGLLERVADDLAE